MLAWKITEQRPADQGHLQEWIRFILSDPAIRRLLEQSPPPIR
jgi:hypothetical protein